MTLFSLAKKNIKGNFSNYFVYFVSLVFSIVIYYTFVSLQYNERILDSIYESSTMAFLFMGSSVVLLIFVAIFILYSNSFFTRKRKKEVGLYSMLGLRKKTIGKMLFYENLIMGVIALFVGIIFGSLLSKIFAMVLIKLMGSTADLSFGISFEAILQTVIVFMVIILFTSFQGYRLIYRFKLIELFHAEKVGEQQPNVSPISTIIGVVLLIVSYWLILRPFPKELTGGYVFGNYGLALILLIIGTQLFFRSVTVYLFKLAKKNKKRYYRGTNLIEKAQLLHRVRGSARTFTVIAILSAFTISLFGATYSGYVGNEKASKEDVPFSYTYLSKGNEIDSKTENIIKSDKKHPIIAQVDIPVIEVEGKLSFELDYLTEPIKLISESTFNQVSDALNRDHSVSISGNKAAVIKPRLTEYTGSLFKGKELKLQNQTLKFIDMVEGSILPFDYPDFFVVVSDELFADISKQKTPIVYKSFEVENENMTEATAMKLNKLIGEDFQVPSSYFLDYKSGKEGNALNLFIFGFLGLVFLAATGSIIYFKQLTEANEVRPQYEILRKIGLSKVDIRTSIKKQTLFVFGMPLLVGIIHGSAILYFTGNFMSNLIGNSMLVPMLTSMGAFVVIYLGYYVLTVNTYNKIVNR